MTGIDALGKKMKNRTARMKELGIGSEKPIADEVES